MEAIVYSPNSVAPIIRSTSINHVSHSTISAAMRVPYSVCRAYTVFYLMRIVLCMVVHPFDPGDSSII